MESAKISLDEAIENMLKKPLKGKLNIHEKTYKKREFSEIINELIKPAPFEEEAIPSQPGSNDSRS